jgi:hypothetical protein
MDGEDNIPLTHQQSVPPLPAAITTALLQPWFLYQAERVIL